MKNDKFLAALVMTSCLFSVSMFSEQAMAEYTLEQEAEITLWSDYIKDYANDAFGYLSRANIHLEAREYAKAIADFDAALKIDQYNTDAYVKRANAKYMTDDLEGALKDYAVALEINQALPEARFNIGRIFYRTQDYKRAVEQMRASVKLDTENPQYRFELARAEYKAGLYSESFANFSKAIELKEDYLDAYYGNGLAAMNLAKYDQAVKCFDKVIQSGQKYDNAYYYKGIAEYQLGQYELAIKDFDVALEENPEDGVIYNMRGKAKELLGEKSDAKKDYKKAKEFGVTAIGLSAADKVTDKAADVAQETATQVAETTAKAEQVVEEVVSQPVAETYPHTEEEQAILDEATNRRLAAENIASGDIYSAVALYDNVVDDDPANPVNYIERAQLKLKVEDWDGAIRDAELALRMDGERKEVFFTQGCAYEGKGNNVLAYRAYAMALREDAQNPEYQYKFANSAFLVGRFAEAQEVFNTLLESNSANYPKAYLTRGKARYQMSEFYSAIADFTKYLTIEPKVADAYFYRAMAKSALKNYQDASEDFSAAVRYDRDNVNYYSFRARNYIALEKYWKASNDYKKIVSLKKDNATTEDHLRVAQVDVLREKYDEALLYIDTILLKDKLNDEVYLSRARLLDAMGKPYEAIHDYSTVLRLNPDQKIVHKERGLLLVDTKSYRKGLLDLNEALKLEPENGKLYYYRALAKQATGDKDGALIDFDMAKRHENL